jgi:phosphoserine phosphatase RsbU/P
MSVQAKAEISACSQSWETERDEARQIQRMLLPAEDLTGPGFEVACRFSPYAEVSGDFADYFRLPNGLVGLYVGDVVGKGLPAAMYAALVMGMLRGINKTGEDSGSVLTLLNKRLLVRPIAGRYAATLYAMFDPATRILIFSNAGLPYPLHASAAGCKPLGEGGLPSGLFAGTTYEVHSVQLEPGDAVLFATDGLHELQDSNGEDFSWARLNEIWGESGRAPARVSLEMLMGEMREFSRGGRMHDDITAVVLKVPPEDGAGEDDAAKSLERSRRIPHSSS